MRSRSQSGKKCAICGGALRRATITHQKSRGRKLHLFHNVPAQVCSVCGEIWIEDSTLREIDRLIEKGKPTRKVETPVYDLAGVTSD